MNKLNVIAWLTIACAASSTAARAQPTIVEREQMRAAAPAKPLVKPDKPRRLLVFTQCKGFVHSAVPYGTAALQALGKKTGAFEVIVSADPADLALERLQKFDALCLNNTTGELFDSDKLQHSLLEYIRSGHGLVGIHAATDCCYEWPEYGKLIGGYFAGHPWNETVALKVDAPGHPVVSMFDQEPFEVADEIYQFRDPYTRDRLRVLLSLDTEHTDMTKAGISRDDGDFAVSWVQNYGRGRVFYCSLGHRHEIFWNPTVLVHYLAGIQFALGDLPANALPSANQQDDGWYTLLTEDDLNEWICKPGSWEVIDGVLTRRGGGDIWSQQPFGDFKLELEFKLADATNSGIFFRTGNIDDPVQTGIELQVLDSHGKADPGKHHCGAIYDCLAPRVNAVKPPGEWNHVRLVCRGPRITAVMNGQPIIDMDLDRWTTPHQNPDGTGNKFRTAYKDMPRRGRLGFQDHGKPVWYRNIRIKPLN